ncbi:MAG: diaminopimelate decarboxylase [Desulfatibacillaceae bacterium]|nr:diaminopimelate decarboxylase [Desulfatibacillaceae bacterium]
MPQKELPFTTGQIKKLAEEYPTPFHIYDEAGIRKTVRRLIRAFSWAPAFKEFFAVKALPNPHILKILKEEGCGADCSSLAELVLAEKAGILGPEIMFTSNDTPWQEFVKARQLSAIINLDDINHIDYLEKHAGLPEIVSMRFNPGPERTGNAIIGDPASAKYGFTREQVLEGFLRLQKKGVKRFGIHTMVASNELNEDYFVQTAVMLFELAAKVFAKTGAKVEFANLGGGIGIPYKPEQKPVDIFAVGQGVKKAYDGILKPAGLDPVSIFLECGRAITGPHGWLVTTALHTKHIYKDYIGVDACMANLMRPGIYGAYHHITVLGKEDAPATKVYDVVGSLCENNDKFAIDRHLPEIEPGDILAIHDTGAHGHAMGFNYNGKLRSAEILLCEDGTTRLIRRAETMDDLFATIV